MGLQNILRVVHINDVISSYGSVKKMSCRKFHIITIILLSHVPFCSNCWSVLSCPSFGIIMTSNNNDNNVNIDNDNDKQFNSE